MPPPYDGPLFDAAVQSWNPAIDGLLEVLPGTGVQRIALFANGRILIDRRRGLDVDRLQGIDAGGHKDAAGQEHQYCESKHARTPSDCKSGTIVHSMPHGAGSSEVHMGLLKVSTMSVSVLFIVSCASPDPPPKQTVFDPLLQAEQRARDVQKTVNAQADATNKAVDTQERGDTSP